MSYFLKFLPTLLLFFSGIVGIVVVNDREHNSSSTKSAWSSISDLYIIFGIFVAFLAGFAIYLPDRAFGVFGEQGAAFEVLLICGVIGSLFYLSFDDQIQRKRETATLILLATAGGALLFVSVNFIELAIALETLALSVYGLCAANLLSARSSEAGIKYFFLGSFASLLIFYGMALAYGAYGSIGLLELGFRIESFPPSLLGKIGFGLLFLGILAKFGAAPMHYWVADAYQGAPVSAFIFMLTVVKVTVFGALIIILRTIAPNYQDLSDSLFWIVSVCSILLGNLLALRQRSLVRMLAFSSIAQAGYLLAGLIALENDLRGVIYYLAFYLFAVLGVVFSFAAAGLKEDQIISLSKLRRSSPLLAVFMTFSFLGLAGLPPALAGLFGKFFIFYPLIAKGWYGLVALALLGSGIGCYYYLRAVAAVYFLPIIDNDLTEGDRIKDMSDNNNSQQVEIAPYSVVAESANPYCQPLTIASLAVCLILLGLGFAPEAFWRIFS
ncbi:MAG TPA: NADH-quinone oxidoreductase subunit N [Oligoflexia bacterium]|nr:NADH-quinone oxidoreductase subunit N [Oligoflexia bacterium]HMP27590.1 NADH-quinone oxidoreductase subunit N [Oligoflexia bacterium]